MAWCGAHGFSTLDLLEDARPPRLELVGATVVVRPGESGSGVAGQPLGELPEALGVRFGLPDDAPFRAASGCAATDSATGHPAALQRLLLPDRTPSRPGPGAYFGSGERGCMRVTTKRSRNDTLSD